MPFIWKDCEECDGTGEVENLCRECDGDGYITENCYECNGEGQVEVEEKEEKKKDIII